MSDEKVNADAESCEAPDLSAFEIELRKLEDAVNRLESGDLTLEEAFREWEEGSTGFQRCRRILSAAKARIEILSRGLADDGDGPRWEDFEFDSESDVTANRPEQEP